MTHIVLPNGEELTDQEVAVFRLMVQGNTEKSAAEWLQISELAVQYHMYLMYRKLGTHTIAQTVCRLRTLGLYNELIALT